MDKEWKELWQQSSEILPNPSVHIDLTKQPLNLVQKIEKTIQWENKFNWVFTLVLTAILVVQGQYLEAGLLVGFMALVFYYYHQLLQKLSTNIMDYDVRSYLTKASQILGNFINHYKIASWAVSTIGLLIGMHYAQSLDKSPTPFDFTKPKFLLIFGMGLFVTLLICHLIIHFMYGGKFKKLKELIKSIEEHEGS